MRFLRTNGTEIELPHEWELAVVQFDGDAELWEQASLEVNGAEWPLYASKRTGIPSICADWPRSGPGAYIIEFRAGDSSDRRTVTIGSAKLGDAGFVALLDDLERRLPASIALSLQRAGGLTGTKLQPVGENTLEQELLRLRRAVFGTAGGPGLARLLPAIAANPHHMLTREEVWLRREQARRVPVAGLVRALTSPGNFAADNRPARVVDSRVEQTFDVHENRLLKVFASEVSARIRRLQATVENNPTAHASLTGLSSTMLGATRQASFLGEVQLPAYVPARLTMVLMREPRYRALLNRYLEFHRSIWATLDDARLESPLRNLPELYQTWGTLEVIAATLEAAVDLGFVLVRERITYRRPGALFIRVLRDGVPALVLRNRETGTQLRLIPERTFGSGGPLRSVSFDQRPDVAIEVERTDGTQEVIILDPKYKLDADDEGSGTPVKSDVDKMHAYRDAIRDAQGSHTVRFAATLYPGTTTHYGLGLAALGAMPGQSTELQGALRTVLANALA